MHAGSSTQLGAAHELISCGSLSDAQCVAFVSVVHPTTWACQQGVHAVTAAFCCCH